MDFFLMTVNVAQGTFYDARDNKPYTVRKLADSSCWMVENLKLALSTGVAVEASNMDGTTFTFTPHSCSSQRYEWDSGSACTFSGSTRSGNGTSFPDEWFYNWYAATAETGTYAMHKVDATGSICPKAWRLPSTARILPEQYDRSYAKLIGTYFETSTDDHIALPDVNKIEGEPLSFIRAGEVHSGAHSNGGLVGAYRTATAGAYEYDASRSYVATSMTYNYDLTSSAYNKTILVNSTYWKTDGYSVRCVAI